MPSCIASASTAPGGTEKCCHVPGKSVNRRSIILTFWDLIACKTSSVVAQLRNMGCSAVSENRSSMNSLGRPRAPHHKSRANVSAHGQSIGTPRSVRLCHPTTATSADMRPLHLLQGRFYVPPSFRFFLLATFFASTGLPCSLDNRLSAMRLQQLSGVVMDFDFFHLHFVMLLLSTALSLLSRSSVRTDK